MNRVVTALLVAALALTGACQRETAARPPAKVAAEDWPFHGRDQQAQRFSPLDEINRGTVGRLGLAWYHQFDTDRGQEATPIEVDGVIYASTAWSTVAALDAATGRPLWTFDPHVQRETLASACCDAVNRGVAVSAGRVFIGALDGRLIALDARSGKQVWSVDTIDHRSGAHYTITGAPCVVKDKIVIGNGGAEFGVRGYVTAYDVKTGRMTWRFYTVPNAQGAPDGAASDAALRAKAAPTWFDGEWKVNGGGGTVWDGMTYDPAVNLLYIGVGNAGPYDWRRRSGGKGDNLFLSSIIALDPDTGRYVWHYQATPSDSWDYDATQSLTAARLAIDGKPRDVLMQADKNGFFYVLDRRTGELLTAKPFEEVTWATGVDMRTGRPIEAANAHYENGPSIHKPGPFGAHSWQPMSFSPRTGLAYIPAQIITGDYEPAPGVKARPIGQNVEIAMKSFPEDKAQMAALRAATRGQLVAWDPVAQKARWSVDHPSFWNGGTLATGGDLVFQGTAEGQLVAYDALTGKRLWSLDAGAGIVAPPISYAVNGRQYVAVMVGFGGAGALVGKLVPDRPRLPGRLMVFELGGTATAALPRVDAPAPIDVRGVTSSGDPGAGMEEYNETCSVCHGANASVRYTADLRRSGALRSAEAWRAIVIGGVLKDQGMIAFDRILTPARAEDIRAYVLDQARKAKPGEQAGR